MAKSKARGIDKQHGNHHAKSGRIKGDVRLSVSEAIGQAVAAYEKEDFAATERLCQLVLGADPACFDALNLLGIIAARFGNHEVAADLFQRAIIVNSHDAMVHSNYANVLSGLSRYDEALLEYEKALLIDPNLLPGLFGRAGALTSLGRLADALECYESILKIDSLIPDVWNSRGTVLHALGKHGDALLSYDKALAIHSDFAYAHFNRGLALVALEQFESAVQSYKSAIAKNPHYAEAFNNLGSLFNQLKQYDEALKCFASALRIKPNYPEALNNQGNALSELKRFGEAIISFEIAISIDPDYVAAHNNLGTALQDSSRYAEALVHYTAALNISPDYDIGFINRGNCYQGLQRFDEAKADYLSAIARSPDNAELNFCLSLCNLLTGDFHQGWIGYEWRWKTTQQKERKFEQPLWLGDCSIAGKKILVHAEQGFGDTIQFCRYVELLSNLGAKVILEVQAPLVSLLDGLTGATCLIKKGEALPDFDFHCPLLSLPLAFGTDLNSIPADIPYLSANRDKVSKWTERLGPKTRPRVGLAWSGSKTHKSDHKRSISFESFVKDLPQQFEYFGLQKEIRDSDLEAVLFHKHVIQLGDQIADFSDTAAICELMDLVVSVDTSVAHLAGALGKETWVVLPWNPDWRWLLDRNDSPWYPTIKLYRQSEPGQWESLLKKVKSDLNGLGNPMEGQFLGPTESAGDIQTESPITDRTASSAHRIHECPICSGNAALLDVVDFNKSCEEKRGVFLPLAGDPVYYASCADCQFTFAPDLSRWPASKFLARIYNEDYVKVDPDYLERRPMANANQLLQAFGNRAREIRHLDYGGGNGSLSGILRLGGWNSTSYDPFPQSDKELGSLGKFNLVTAFEVFEHVPDVNRLMRNVSDLLDESGLVLFSTMLSDGHVEPRRRLDWWYASPRNGHISLYSSKSLQVLAAKSGLTFFSISNAFHCLVSKNIPEWAKPIIQIPD